MSGPNDNEGLDARVSNAFADIIASDAPIKALPTHLPVRGRLANWCDSEVGRTNQYSRPTCPVCAAEYDARETRKQARRTGR